jgi:hypothetical protein
MATTQWNHDSVIDVGPWLVVSLTAFGGKVCPHAEYSGKLVETAMRDREGRKFTAQGLYEKDRHQAYVHAFKDSDDVLVSFLNGEHAVFIRINGWSLCACMVESGYKLVDFSPKHGKSTGESRECD